MEETDVEEASVGISARAVKAQIRIGDVLKVGWRAAMRVGGKRGMMVGLSTNAKNK